MTLTSKSECECLDNEYFDNKEQKCLTCNSACKECETESYQCKSCATGLTQDPTTKFCCDSNYFGVIQKGLAVCEECSENCLTCTTSKT